MFGYMTDELGNRALGFLGLQMWILDERRCMQLVLYLLVKNEQLFQSEIMTNKFFCTHSLTKSTCSILGSVGGTWLEILEVSPTLVCVVSSGFIFKFFIASISSGFPICT